MKKEDVIFERKEFLNLPGHNGMANIVANIVNQTYRDDELEKHLDVKLDFADCDRRVSMYIDIGSNEYENENAIYKVDMLIDVLTDFRKAIKKEIKIQDKLRKKREKLKEKNDG